MNNCCVVGCTNYVGKASGLRFYRFPMADEVKQQKAADVCRDPWEPQVHTQSSEPSDPAAIGMAAPSDIERNLFAFALHCS